MFDKFEVIIRRTWGIEREEMEVFENGIEDLMSFM